jgi:hypothetical protein
VKHRLAILTQSTDMTSKVTPADPAVFLPSS